jgi:Fic-DOC domain mobile mystery protein B
MSDLFRADFGDTPLTADEQQGLIPSLTTQRELNEFEFANIVSGRRWAMSPRRLAQAEILNMSYLLELHRRMFNATWRWAGRIRTTEKTIGVTPHRIIPDLATSLGDVVYWMENAVYPPDEIAVRFHHRLVAIHLFSNGNGRHSRLVGDILALKLGRPIFAWGAGSASGAQARKDYLAAIGQADFQDYAALIKFARGPAATSL